MNFTKTVSPTFANEVSSFVEKIFTETKLGGPTSMLTKLSSVVELSIFARFPTQSTHCTVKGIKPPSSSLLTI